MLILQIIVLYAVAVGLLLLLLTHFLIPPALQSAATAALRLVIWDTSAKNPFTPAETQHLHDVHQVVFRFFAIAILCAAVLFWQKRKVSRHAYKTAAGLITSITILGFLFFPLFFESFHRLFFPQGNYAFPSDSLLIQTFPISFWLTAFALLQILVIAVLLFQAHRAGQEKL